MLAEGVTAGINGELTVTVNEFENAVAPFTSVAEHVMLCVPCDNGAIVINPFAEEPKVDAPSLKT